MASDDNNLADPVIVSSNRLSDIGPYVRQLFQEDAETWGSIFPWEFPQSASREEEESFLRRSFTDREIHMQGGASPPGNGFRFLKQVWYSTAIWNFETRIPAVADDWIRDNQDLVTDPAMTGHIFHPDVRPSTFFNQEAIQMYGEKFLSMAIAAIQYKLRAPATAFEEWDEAIPAEQDIPQATETGELEPQHEQFVSEDSHQSDSIQLETTDHSGGPSLESIVEVSDIVTNPHASSPALPPEATISARISGIDPSSPDVALHDGYSGVDQEHPQHYEPPHRRHPPAGRGKRTNFNNDRRNGRQQHHANERITTYHQFPTQAPLGFAAPYGPQDNVSNLMHVASDRSSSSQYEYMSPALHTQPFYGRQADPYPAPSQSNVGYLGPSNHSEFVGPTAVYSQAPGQNPYWPVGVFEDRTNISNASQRAGHGGSFAAFDTQHDTRNTPRRESQISRGGRAGRFNSVSCSRGGRRMSNFGPVTERATEEDRSFDQGSYNTFLTHGRNHGGSKNRRFSAARNDKIWRTAERPSLNENDLPISNTYAPPSLSNRSNFGLGLRKGSANRDEQARTAMATLDLERMPHPDPTDLGALHLRQPRTELCCARDWIGINCHFATKLIIFGVPLSLAAEQMHSFFAQFGGVQDIRPLPVNKNIPSRPSSRLVFVVFADSAGARECLKHNNQPWMGGNLHVEVAREHWDPSHQRFSGSHHQEQFAHTHPQTPPADKRMTFREKQYKPSFDRENSSMNDKDHGRAEESGFRMNTELSSTDIPPTASRANTPKQKGKNKKKQTNFIPHNDVHKSPSELTLLGEDQHGDSSILEETSANTAASDAEAVAIVEHASEKDTPQCPQPEDESHCFPENGANDETVAFNQIPRPEVKAPPEELVGSIMPTEKAESSTTEPMFEQEQGLHEGNIDITSETHETQNVVTGDNGSNGRSNRSEPVVEDFEASQVGIQTFGGQHDEEKRLGQAQKASHGDFDDSSVSLSSTVDKVPIAVPDLAAKPGSTGHESSAVGKVKSNDKIERDSFVQPVSETPTTPATSAMPSDPWSASPATAKKTENPKGPAQTESFSQFAKSKQPKKPKSAKSKGSVKGKPKPAPEAISEGYKGDKMNDLIIDAQTVKQKADEQIIHTSVDTRPETNEGSEAVKMKSNDDVKAGLYFAGQTASPTKDASQPATPTKNRGLGSILSLFGANQSSHPVVSAPADGNKSRGEETRDAKSEGEANHEPAPCPLSGLIIPTGSDHLSLRDNATPFPLSELISTPSTEHTTPSPVYTPLDTEHIADEPDVNDSLFVPEEGSS